MNAPEAYIQFTPGLITEDGEVTDETTEMFLREFMEQFEQFMERVFMVLPRASGQLSSGPLLSRQAET
jgi:chromate reductase, NAD(P)H dehydrogenase (quinone)